MIHIYFLSRLLSNLLDSDIQLSHRACIFLKLVHFLMLTKTFYWASFVVILKNDCNFFLTSQQPGIGGEGKWRIWFKLAKSDLGSS